MIETLHQQKSNCNESIPLKTIGNYTFQQSIGRGSMGKVKLGVHNVTGEKIAVKIVPRANYQIMSQSIHCGKSIQQITKEKAREENREIRTIREAHIMLFLKHPNIVKMKDIICHDAYFYILMDYVDGTQLLHYIVKHQRLSERRTKHFTRQIVSALDYLHRNSIVHRDLKIENIMVDKSGRHIKIIDFGLSNLFCPERQLTTYCGSLYFAAPELLRAIPYNGPEVDIWSLGVVIYVMITGAVPFDDTSMPRLHDKIKRGHVTYPSFINTQCQDLLSRIFVTDPKHRIIMTDIMHHPWLEDTGLINNYMPIRKPLHLPLNPKVIEKISVGFNLGTPEHIERQLALILQAPVYRDAISHVEDCQARKQHLIYDGPQSVPAAYHPLISLYYLAAEKLVSIEHEKHQKRMPIRSSSLSRQGSMDDLFGDSSAQSSQHSLVDGVRLLSDVPLSQTRVGSILGFEPTAIHSSNYLNRIQQWLRSSISQHHLSSESSHEPPQERLYPHTTSPPPPSHASKSLFRKLSHAFIRKNSLNKKPQSPHMDHNRCSPVLEHSNRYSMPPPIKEHSRYSPILSKEHNRYSMPPLMDQATHTSARMSRYESTILSPSIPTISRSASFASASFHRRRGSISKLTDKMNTWLNRSQLNKTEA